MEYYEPNFLDEALVVLDRFGPRAAVLAGGTLSGQRLREHPHSVDALVNIKRIRPLSEVAFGSGELHIGALLTARELAEHALIRAHAPLVALAARSIGAPQLRSVATLGGNLLSAHHAADVAVALLAYDAVASIVTLREDAHEMPVERMLSPGFAGLAPGSLITGVRLTPARGSRCAFEKMQNRRAFELALVSVGASIAFDANDQVVDARLALGGAAPTPIRATAAESVLAGVTLEGVHCAEAARVASEVDAEPADDHRASGEYRRHLVRVLVERALRSVRGDPFAAQS